MRWSRAIDAQASLGLRPRPRLGIDPVPLGSVGQKHLTASAVWLPVSSAPKVCMRVAARAPRDAEELLDVPAREESTVERLELG